MNISTKFDIDDKVWKIVRSRPKVWEQCQFCGGSTSLIDTLYNEGTGVTGLDGTTKKCPDCYGRGGAHKYLELEWYVLDDSPYTVGQIQMQLGHNPKETYMCHETGVGSGAVYRAEDLFATREQAEAECATRNQEEITDG